MQALRATLDAGRGEPLTGVQLQQVVIEISKQPTLIDRSRGHLYVIKALKQGIINPDVLLPIAISEIKTSADLTMVAISLRNGANRNLYVHTPNIGSTHIIVYTVVTLRNSRRDTNLILSTILVLLILGSQTSAPAYDQSKSLTEIKEVITGPKIDSGFLAGISSVLSPGLTRTVTPTPAPVEFGTKSVQDWLTSQGLPPFDDLSATLSGLKASSRMVLGIITDRPDLTYTETSTVTQSLLAPVRSPSERTPAESAREIASTSGQAIPNLEDVLACRSTQVIKAYPTNRGLRIMNQEHGEYVSVARTVEAAYSDAFQHFVDFGLAVTYFTVNRLIIELRSAYHVNDTTLIAELQNMLLYAIRHGTTLDMDQMSLISTTSEALGTEILQEYRQPLWSKICAVPPIVAPETPDSLRSLAFSLNLDPSAGRQAICTEIKTLASASPEALKKAAILRQKARVGATVSTISEFTAGLVPAVTCENKTALGTDPLEYGDAYMSFYRDDRGKLWCFTSDMYQSLIASPINPNDQRPLPASFVSQVKERLDVLKQLGIIASAPVSMTKAISDLSSPDQVSDTESKYIVSTMIQSAEVAGITETKFRSLTPSQMNRVLASIRMEQPSITTQSEGLYIMGPSHQFTTFCRAGYVGIRENSSLARKFFSAIKTVS